MRSKLSTLKKEISKENTPSQSLVNKNTDGQLENENVDKQSLNTSVTQNNCNNIQHNNTNNNLNNIQTLPNEVEIPDKNKKRILNLINKNLVDDLDSIYFFDKINMRTKSATHNNVPKLNFNFLEVETSKNKVNVSLI